MAFGGLTLFFSIWRFGGKNDSTKMALDPRRLVLAAKVYSADDTFDRHLRVFGDCFGHLDSVNQSSDQIFSVQSCIVLMHCIGC